MKRANSDLGDSMKKPRPRETESLKQSLFDKMSPTSLFAVVAAVALVFRILYFMQLKNNSPVYQRIIHDSALFNELAHRVLEHGPVLDTAYYISPLYIYFLALVYKIFGDAFNTVRFVQFFLGIGTSVLTAAIALKIYGKKVALLAGFMAAVYAPMLFFEGNMLGTSLVAFLLVAACYLLIIAPDLRFRYLVYGLAGLFLALAICGRPNLLLLAPLPILYFVFILKPEKNTIIAGSAIYLLGLAIPILLTGLHNKKAGGEFVLLTTHGGINFYIGNHHKATGSWQAPEGIEASVSAINLEQSRAYAERELGRSLSASEVSAFWYKKALKWGMSHPIQWLGLLGKKFLLFWTGYETPLNFDYYFHQKYAGLLRIPIFNLPFYMPLVIIGLWFALRSRGNGWLIVGVVLLTCLSVVMFVMADRYRAVVAPFMIILAALAVVDFLRMIALKQKRFWVVAGLFLALLVANLTFTQNKLRGATFGNDYYNLALSHLIDGNIDSSIYWGQRAIIADPTNANAFYNLGVAYLRNKDYDRALDTFERVLELDPESAGANRSIGAILLTRQQYYRAKRLLEMANRLEPNNPRCLMNLGLAYYYTRDFQKAIETWRQLEKIEPNNEQVKNNIKAAEYELGRN